MVYKFMNLRSVSSLCSSFYNSQFSYQHTIMNSQHSFNNMREVLKYVRQQRVRDAAYIQQLILDDKYYLAQAVRSDEDCVLLRKVRRPSSTGCFQAFRRLPRTLAIRSQPVWNIERIENRHLSLELPFHGEDNFYAEGLSDVAASAWTTLSDLLALPSAAMKTLESVVRSSDALHTLLEQIQSIFSGEPDMIQKWAGVAAVLNLFWNTECAWGDIVSAIVAILCQLGLSKSVLNRFTSFASDLLNHFSSSFSAEASGGPQLGAVGLILGMIPAVFGHSVPSVTRVSSSLASFARANMGLEKIGVIWEWIQDQYCEYMYGKTMTQRRFEEQCPLFETYTKNVTAIQEIKPVWLDVHKDLCQFVIDVFRQGERIYQEMRADKHISSFVNQMQRRILSLYDVAQRSSAISTIERSLPHSIYLYGPAGVGKTSFQQMLVARLYKRYFSSSPFSLSRCAISRKCENEYWDGYYGQPICVYDDVYQAADSKANPNPEILETIRVINDDPFHLHMSSIEDKKNTYFSSKVVIGTSNTKRPNIQSIVSPDAVYRRWKMCAQISVDPAYGKKVDGVDHLVVDPTRVSSILDPKIYKVILYNMRDVNTAPLETLTFDQFVERVFQMMEDENTVQNNRVALLEKLAGVEPIPDSEELKEWRDKFQAQSSSDEEGDDFQDASAFAPDLTPLNLDIGPDHPSYHTVLLGRLRVLVHDSPGSTSSDFDEDGLPVLNLPEPCSEPVQKWYDVVQEKIAKAAKLTRRWCSRYIDLYTPVKKVFSFLPPQFIGLLIVTLLLRVKEHLCPSCTLYSVSSVFSLWERGRAVERCARSKCVTCKKLYDLYYRDHTPLVCSDKEKVGFCYDVLMQAIYIAPKKIAYKLSALLVSQRGKLALMQSQGPSGDYVTARAHGSHQRICAGCNRKIPKRWAKCSFCLEAQAPSGDFVTPRAQSSTQVLCQCGNKMPSNWRQCPHCQTSNHEAEGDFNAYETAEKVWTRNIVRISATAAGTNCMYALYVTGRIILVPYHFLNMCGASFYLTNYENDQAQRIPLQECKVHQMRGQTGRPIDLALIGLPRYVASRPNIVNHFLSEGELPRLQHCEVFRMKVEKGERCCFSGAITDVRANMTYTSAFGPCFVEQNVLVDCMGKAGDCGLPYFVENTTLTRKMMGVHVAGNKKGTSVCTLVTQEALAAAIEKNAFGAIHKRDIAQESWLVPNTAVKAARDLQLSGDILYLGKAEQSPVQPVKSCLQPSLIQESGEWYATVSKPAHLKKVTVGGQTIDPLLKGIQKVCKLQEPIPDDLLAIAKNDVASVLGFGKNSKKTVLTYAQAIQGDETDPFLTAINRSSSPGFPYNLANPGKGKQHWLGKDEYVLDEPQLKGDVLHLIEQAKQNVRGEVYFTAVLKDERRPISKVDEGKTRVFEAAPMHFVLAVRMYFLNFAAHLSRYRIFNEVCVGINPFSAEWDQLAKSLTKYGDRVFAGDFSNFDGSLTQKILWTVLELINEWYDDSEENQLVREVLFEEMCNTRVLCRGNILQQTHSQPSGNPLTVVINSIFNMLVMRLAYLQCKLDGGYGLECDFRDHVSLAVYGDDNVVGVSEPASMFYNQKTVTDALSRFGLTYTDEGKTGEVVEMRCLTEVSFLKRAFVYSGSQWIAPLDISVVREMCNWVRGSEVRSQTVENCMAASAEFALHGSDLYDAEMQRLRRILSRYGIYPRFATYYEWIDYYRSVGTDLGAPLHSTS